MQKVFSQRTIQIRKDNNMKKRIISVAAILAMLFGPMSLQTAQSQILILDENELKVIELEGEIGEEEEKEKEEEKEEAEGTERKEDDIDVDEQGLELPMKSPGPGITIDKYAPLGGEIFVLGCLGGAYLLGMRRRKE